MEIKRQQSIVLSVYFNGSVSPLSPTSQCIVADEVGFVLATSGTIWGNSLTSFFRKSQKLIFFLYSSLFHSCLTVFFVYFFILLCLLPCFFLFTSLFLLCLLIYSSLFTSLFILYLLIYYFLCLLPCFFFVYLFILLYLLIYYFLCLLPCFFFVYLFILLYLLLFHFFFVYLFSFDGPLSKYPMNKPTPPTKAFPSLSVCMALTDP